MSYDVYIRTRAGQVFVANYTYNVAAMLDQAYGHPFRDLHGLRGDVAMTRTLAAMRQFVSRYDAMRALEPANGWGSAEGCWTFLAEIALGCGRYPDGVVVIA